MLQRRALTVVQLHEVQMGRKWGFVHAIYEARFMRKVLRDILTEWLEYAKEADMPPGLVSSSDNEIGRRRINNLQDSIRRNHSTIGHTISNPVGHRPASSTSPHTPSYSRRRLPR